jgi:hypothetical protein
MKLTDLRPEHSRVQGTDRHALTFDCARCGHPYRIHVQFHRGSPEVGVWQWVATPGDVPDLASLTLVPSIAFHTHGPRHPSCGWHVNIVGGEIRDG